MKATCIRDCFGPMGRCYRTKIYDIDPSKPWAVHFEFEDPEAQKIRDKTETEQKNTQATVNASAIDRKLDEQEKATEQQQRDLERLRKQNAELRARVAG